MIPEQLDAELTGLLNGMDERELKDVVKIFLMKEFAACEEDATYGANAVMDATGKVGMFMVKTLMGSIEIKLKRKEEDGE